MRDQIQHAVAAEGAEFDRAFFTEHRFQPTGLEHSPDPLLNQMAVAARMDTIKLYQGTNIITRHDPIRFAE